MAQITETSDAVRMASQVASRPAKVSRPDSDAPEGWRKFWVFFEWCLQYQAYSKRTYFLVLLPVVVAAIVFTVTLSLNWFPRRGRQLFTSLGWVSAFSLAVLGIRHASRAVCWELSEELRELVRLTGIRSSTLLWTQSTTRWFTILVSVLLVSPLIAYCRTLGGIDGDKWIAAGWGLLLVVALTASFAMMASVSSSGAKNADATAANATFFLILFYHVFFWGGGTIIWVQRLTPRLLANSWSQFWFDLAPFRQVYRSLSAPDLFSPLEPAYWLHFPVAIAGTWMATRIMRNQFHSEAIQPDQSRRVVRDSAGAMRLTLLRPRCSERPFFWKDTYILGGSRFAEAFWRVICVLAMIGVILAIYCSIAFDNPASIVVAILVTSAAPWVVALQFDSMMAAEFRDKTWGTLLLLPVNWFEPIVAKAQAAIWLRRWMFLPITVAAIDATIRAPYAMFITFTIASLSLPILIEVSVLSQFNAKKWWAGALVAILVIVLIAAIVTVWILFPNVFGLFLTINLMSITIFGMLSHIRWRMHNWTGD